MKAIKTRTQRVAAAKAGMSVKTGRKYLRHPELIGATRLPRTYRTRPDPFAHHWPEINTLLEAAPELQAQTLLTYLMQAYPERYHEGHLRSLQRRVQVWRAEYGKEKNVIFLQTIKPGQQSQSDWTSMNDLGVTLAGQAFPHLLFHFMLPYSSWENILICQSESLDTLTLGFERSVGELGGVLPEHRTDNLSAATKRHNNRRQFTDRWQSFLDYYGVKPSRNNPGESHENGSVEKSHHLFKNAVKQYLLLRGSNDFPDQKAYEAFLKQIKDQRNASRSKRLQEELPFLKALPNKQWRAPTILPVRVSPSSIVHILNIPYSVPSRLISLVLKAYVYPEDIELYYGQKCLQRMPRQYQGYHIDYRHIIDTLVRKPGAFFNYQYQEALFPRPLFREVFDELMKKHPLQGHKIYLKLLQFAKMHGEQTVTTALDTLLEAHLEITLARVKQLVEVTSLPCPQIHITQPHLAAYDQLHHFTLLEAAV